jgi:putative redox protein
MAEVDLGVEQYWAGMQAGLDENEILVTDSGQAPWGQVLLSRNHALFADEPAELEGKDTGPTPTQLVLMALGGCTAITVRVYAARKGWAIDRIAVRLRYGLTGSAQDYAKIDRKIEIEGTLDDEQRARLFAIAEKCPVHKMLTKGVAVQSELAA